MEADGFEPTNAGPGEEEHAAGELPLPLPLLLPADILTRHVWPKLGPGSQAALRATCRALRASADAAVGPRLLAALSPQELVQAVSAARAAAGECPSSSEQASTLRGLCGLLAKAPAVCSLHLIILGQAGPKACAVAAAAAKARAGLVSAPTGGRPRGAGAVSARAGGSRQSQRVGTNNPGQPAPASSSALLTAAALENALACLGVAAEGRLRELQLVFAGVDMSLDPQALCCTLASAWPQLEALGLSWEGSGKQLQLLASSNSRAPSSNSRSSNSSNSSSDTTGTAGPTSSGDGTALNGSSCGGGGGGSAAAEALPVDDGRTLYGLRSLCLAADSSQKPQGQAVFGTLLAQLLHNCTGGMLPYHAIGGGGNHSSSSGGIPTPGSSTAGGPQDGGGTVGKLQAPLLESLALQDRASTQPPALFNPGAACLWAALGSLQAAFPHLQHVSGPTNHLQACVADWQQQPFLQQGQQQQRHGQEQGQQHQLGCAKAALQLRCLGLQERDWEGQGTYQPGLHQTNPRAGLHYEMVDGGPNLAQLSMLPTGSFTQPNLDILGAVIPRDLVLSDVTWRLRLEVMECVFSQLEGAMLDTLHTQRAQAGSISNSCSSKVLFPKLKKLVLWGEPCHAGSLHSLLLPARTEGDSEDVPTSQHLPPAPARMAERALAERVWQQEGPEAEHGGAAAHEMHSSSPWRPSAVGPGCHIVLAGGHLASCSSASTTTNNNNTTLSQLGADVAAAMSHPGGVSYLAVGPVDSGVGTLEGTLSFYVSPGLKQELPTLLPSLAMLRGLVVEGGLLDMALLTKPTDRGSLSTCLLGSMPCLRTLVLAARGTADVSMLQLAQLLEQGGPQLLPALQEVVLLRVATHDASSPTWRAAVTRLVEARAGQGAEMVQEAGPGPGKGARSASSRHGDTGAAAKDGKGAGKPCAAGGAAAQLSRHVSSQGGQPKPLTVKIVPGILSAVPACKRAVAQVRALSRCDPDAVQLLVGDVVPRGQLAWGR